MFKSKDAKNNYSKEDAETQEYKDKMKELENLNKTCNTNLAIVELKQKNYREAVKFAEEAIKGDRSDLKPVFIKARALFENSDFMKASEFFSKVLNLDPEHAEAK